MKPHTAALKDEPLNRGMPNIADLLRSSRSLALKDSGHLMSASE